jgi:hypothetical protein
MRLAAHAEEIFATDLQRVTQHRIVAEGVGVAADSLG